MRSMPSGLVSTEITGDRFAPVSLWQYDRQDTAHQQVLPDRIAVLAFVGQQRHEVLNSAVILRFAAGQDEADRASLIVAAGMDFARKAAARPTQSHLMNPLT